MAAWTLEGCADACDTVAGRVGMGFSAGLQENFQSLSEIKGSFKVVGEIAAVKQ
jgi:hypothetical protein